MIVARLSTPPTARSSASPAAHPRRRCGPAHAALRDPVLTAIGPDGVADRNESACEDAVVFAGRQLLEQEPRPHPHDADIRVLSVRMIPMEAAAYELSSSSERYRRAGPQAGM